MGILPKSEVLRISPRSNLYLIAAMLYFFKDQIWSNTKYKKEKEAKDQGDRDRYRRKRNGKAEDEADQKGDIKKQEGKVEGKEESKGEGNIEELVEGGGDRE